MEVLSEQEYIDKCWTLVDHYIEGVRSGDIVTGTYIKKAVDRYVRDVNRKHQWDYHVKKVDKVFAFFSFIRVELKDKWVQFPLLDWQCFFIAMAFGFYYKNSDKRKYKEVFLFIGRKNGKSAFAASLQIYGLLLDGVATPQSLLIANTAKQALNALNYAKGIIINTPILRNKLSGQRYRIVFNPKYRKSLGFCEIMSSVEPARLQGYKPSMAILDEIHGFKDSKVLNAIRTGTGATLNPMTFLITTAGSKDFPFCQDYLAYHKSILDDKVENETAFGLIYQPDPEDDLADPNCWIKANPSLGSILDIQDLKIDFENALHSISDKYEFLTTRLNVFWEDPETWIPEETVLECFKDFDIDKFKGRSCWIGLDLSRTSDLSSLVVLFHIEEEDKFYAIPFYWFANRPDDEQRPNGRSLTQWIQSGYITRSHKKIIDLDEVFKTLMYIKDNFNITCVYYDKFNAIHLTQKMKENMIPCEEFPQTAMRFNTPMKMLEQFVYEKKITFQNNPVLLWNFSNVVIIPDSNANIKVNKNRQHDAVDGVVALAMALGGYIESIYGDEILGLKSYINK